MLADYEGVHQNFVNKALEKKATSLGSRIPSILDGGFAVIIAEYYDVKQKRYFNPNRLCDVFASQEIDEHKEEMTLEIEALTKLKRTDPALKLNWSIYLPDEANKKTASSFIEQVKAQKNTDVYSRQLDMERRQKAMQPLIGFQPKNFFNVVDHLTAFDFEYVCSFLLGYLSNRSLASIEHPDLLPSTDPEIFKKQKARANWSKEAAFANKKLVESYVYNFQTLLELLRLGFENHKLKVLDQKDYKSAKRVVNIFYGFPFLLNWLKDQKMTHNDEATKDIGFKYCPPRNGEKVLELTKIESGLVKGGIFDYREAKDAEKVYEIVKFLGLDPANTKLFDKEEFKQKARTWWSNTMREQSAQLPVKKPEVVKEQPTQALIKPGEQIVGSILEKVMSKAIEQVTVVKPNIKIIIDNALKDIHEKLEQMHEAEDPFWRLNAEDLSQENEKYNNYLHQPKKEPVIKVAQISDQNQNKFIFTILPETSHAWSNYPKLEKVTNQIKKALEECLSHTGSFPQGKVDTGEGGKRYKISPIHEEFYDPTPDIPGTKKLITHEIKLDNHGTDIPYWTRIYIVKGEKGPELVIVKALHFPCRIND